MCDDYCPAPSFGVIFDELEPGLEVGDKDINKWDEVLNMQTEDIATASIREVINLDDVVQRN